MWCGDSNFAAKGATHHDNEGRWTEHSQNKGAPTKDEDDSRGSEEGEGKGEWGWGTAGGKGAGLDRRCNSFWWIMDWNRK